MDKLYPFIALCARPQGHDSSLNQHLADMARQITAWDMLASLAEKHSMAPLLYTHLRQANLELPQLLLRELKGLYLRHQHANQVRGQVLADILGAYQQAGIATLVLKGAALAYLSYPQPGLRPMRDMDLLVPKSEMYQAQQILAEMGFDAPPTYPAGLKSHHHLSAANKTIEGFNVSVEVHHNLFLEQLSLSLDFDSLYPRALAFTMSDDITAYTLGYEDMLWHMCHHIANIVQPFRLIWVADIVGFAEQFARDIDWAWLRAHYPRVLDILGLFHTMTPLPDTFLKHAGIQPGPAPRGIGQEFQGWPRYSLHHQRDKGYMQILRDSLFPSEWWLRLYYGIGPHRSLLWPRWGKHPLHITALVWQLFWEKSND